MVELEPPLCQQRIAPVIALYDEAHLNDSRNFPQDGAKSQLNKAFWREKTFAQMSKQEWESLCDGCGKCCLHKLEDEDTGEIFYTGVACKLLDVERCRCTHYRERCDLVPECLDLRRGFDQFHWLPATCAYRLLAQGEDLPAWHPLISGRAESVHEAGVSVRSFAIPESQVEDIADHVIEWLD